MNTTLMMPLNYGKFHSMSNNFKCQANRLEEIENLYMGINLGPTVDQLRAKGKTWEQIIESSTRPGGQDLGF